MRTVVQRVARASVTINGEERRSVGRGLVVLLGIGKDDSAEDAVRLADRIPSLRIFPDEEGKFDRSALEIRGDLLVVSQFTLYGDCRRGKRPDFTGAARPEAARELCRVFVERIRGCGLTVVTGEFAADMLVEIANDGPVTLIIDTDDKKPPRPAG